MMTRYIVFAGRLGGIAEFDQVVGYLDALVDQEILNAVKSGDIWKPEDIDLVFYGDKQIKQVLQSLSQKLPERYVAFRAHVVDEDRVNRTAPKMCERYELEYRLYDSQIEIQ